MITLFITVLLSFTNIGTDSNNIDISNQEPTTQAIVIEDTLAM